MGVRVIPSSLDQATVFIHVIVRFSLFIIIIIITAFIIAIFLFLLHAAAAVSDIAQENVCFSAICIGEAINTSVLMPIVLVLVATKGRVILQQVVDMPALHLSESSL